MSNKSSVEFRARMKAENRCVKCGRPTSGYITDSGKFKQYTICEKHRTYHRNYDAKKRLGMK
jgi:hypothetical protein